MTTEEKLTMSLGEAMFSQRAIRRFKPGPIPDEDLHAALEAATKAPSGSNLQPWRFIVIRDPELKEKFGKLYHEAWWAKRRDQGIFPKDIPPGKGTIQSARQLADEIGQAPVIVLVCATSQGPASMASVIPAAQNLLLAARGQGIGGVLTTLHPDVDEQCPTSCSTCPPRPRSSTASPSATREAASAPPNANPSPKSSPTTAGTSPIPNPPCHPDAPRGIWGGVPSPLL